MHAMIDGAPQNPTQPLGLGAAVWGRICRRWRVFWVWRSGFRGFGRFAAWLASLGTGPFHQGIHLANLTSHGFISPWARISHPNLKLGWQVYLGEGVVVYASLDSGEVDLADRVQIYGNTFIETGMGGRIRIDEGTHIQPGCHFHAYISGISIGKKCEIAPGCAFYCYDHGMVADIPIMDQPLISKGDITVGDGAWIGYGVTVLQGVTIGEGAVVAAGAVVTRDVPAHAIAAGIPAKVIGSRIPAA